MKKYIVVIAALAIVLSVTNVFAKTDSKNEKSNNKSAVATFVSMQHKDSLEFEKSKSTKKNNKVIAIYTESTASSTTYALTRDRHVWTTTGGLWTDINRTLPTSTPSIKQWQPNAFLDASGNVWRWTGSAWVSVLHP